MTLYILSCIIFAMIIMNYIDRKPDVKKAYEEDKILFFVALAITALLWPVSLTMMILVRIFR